MALSVIGGKVVNRDLRKQRVCLITSIGQNTLQLISTTMLIRSYEKTPGGAPLYEGPTFAAFENIRHAYAETFRDMTYVGALAAVPAGEFAGHIDWIKPSDGAQIADRRKQLTASADEEDAALGTATIKLPAHLESDSAFVLDLMLDPQLNAELARTTGGGDMLACILNAAIRVSNKEA